MVAETTPSPVSAPTKRPRKTVPFRLPEQTRHSVRALYVVRGLSPAQIALAVNLTPEQVRNLISREKWTALRAKGENGRKSKIEAETLARADDDVKRTVEAVAILSEDLTLRSLNLCSEQLDAKDAKGLQMASGAARNFVQIARMSRGLDSRAQNSPGNGANAGSATVIFVGELPRAEKRIEKQAEAVEVSATQLPAPSLPVSPTT